MRRIRSFRLARTILAVDVLETRELLAVNLVIDYSLDKGNYFNTATKRDLLQNTLNAIVSRFGDTLAATPSITTSIPYGDSNTSQTVTTSTPANTLKIYAFGAPLSGGAVGTGGPVFSSTAPYRGQGANDFAPDFSYIMFDNDGSTNWFYGATTSGLTSNQTDFVSVARHEFLHSIGLVEQPTFTRLVANDQFTGPAAKAANGGQNVQLNADGVHIAGNNDVFSAVTLQGTRHDLTAVEYGMLDDIGWDVRPSAVANTSGPQVGVYLPTSDVFAIAQLNTNPAPGVPLVGQSVFNYGFHVGGVSSIPLTGDFNGDGILDAGIYVPSRDLFALNFLSASGTSIGQNVFSYGFHTGGVFSIPVVGDFNGDGTSDVGIYLPSRDMFALAFVNPNPTASTPITGQNVFNYGAHPAGTFNVPITGDFNGDGTTDVGIYLPVSDLFALAFLNPSPTPTTQLKGQSVFAYGGHVPGVFSVPVTGDFNGDGQDDVGIYAPASDLFALAFLNAKTSPGSPLIGQNVYPYGGHAPGVFSIPVTGDFNDDGVDDVGIYAPVSDLFALAYLNPKPTATSKFTGQNVFTYGFHTGGVFSTPISSGSGTSAASGGTIQGASLAGDVASATSSVVAQAIPAPSTSSTISSQAASFVGMSLSDVHDLVLDWFGREPRTRRRAI
ncbi:hypothetical protein [Singulisphaera sp. PoT]|uniref:hypothetical protein n=1 Tax=Singulisphaera sp. PoT TaxID=3411797 RepID=UPI003BF5B550